MNERFKSRQSLAGALEPGDATHYEMVVVEMWDTYEVIVLNDGFFDRICFLKSNPAEHLETYRNILHDNLMDEDGNSPIGTTNPWTIKAAKEMLLRFRGEWKDE